MPAVRGLVVCGDGRGLRTYLTETFMFYGEFKVVILSV